jgi:hypothetical protein
MSEGVINFWVQPLDGGPPYPLTDFDSGFAIRLQPSSDGTLYLSMQSMMNDAVMITDFR